MSTFIIKSLQLQELIIPFRVSFKHSSAERAATESILVIAHSMTGEIAYGESCPRSYVTGETIDSSKHFFKQHESDIIHNIVDLETLKLWIKNNEHKIDENPAAWCAIELALLDLFAKIRRESVERLLSLRELTREFKYTAVLGNGSMDTYLKLLEQYRALGFTDFKLKLSGDAEHDKKRCEALASRITNPRIRLDANNLWKHADDAIDYMNFLECDAFALEEPLQENDINGMSLISKKLKIKIILDESFIRYQQFDQLDHSLNWIINIRISKMGGLLRSIAIADQAKKLGINCIVGAQVGETSLLTRAALTLVNSYHSIVIAQEGACGTYLLKKDICRPVLMFGKGGQIAQNQLSVLNNSGFGLTVNINENHRNLCSD